MGTPGTTHVQGFAVFGTEYMLSNCFPWGKDDDEEEEEEGGGGHSLRSQRTYGLVWTIRRECTQITASAQSARSLTCTYLAVASHQKDASQVLRSSWAQPALARRKMPELRWLKGLVVDVIVIFLHSIGKGSWKNSPLSAQTFPELTTFLWQQRLLLPKNQPKKCEPTAPWENFF